MGWHQPVSAVRRRGSRVWPHLEQRAFQPGVEPRPAFREPRVLQRPGLQERRSAERQVLAFPGQPVPLAFPRGVEGRLRVLQQQAEVGLAAWRRVLARSSKQEPKPELQASSDRSVEAVVWPFVLSLEDGASDRTLSLAGTNRISEGYG
jgi:hypothetical protein